MLESLHIENYVLIAQLDLSFEEGFSVITGETGAGKSVLMGAIALLMGQRADLKVIKEGCKRCCLEGVFSADEQLKPFFEAQDLVYDETGCTLRRELYDNGKSRAFVNDSPVPLTCLKELGTKLMDIHSQHENLLLGSDAFQREVIDRVSGSGAELQAYQASFRRHAALKRQLQELREQAVRAAEEHDYLAFQFRQLDEARLEKGEQESLEAEIDLLSHADEVKAGLSELSDLMGNDTDGICTRLRDSVHLSDRLKDVYPSLGEASQRLESSLVDLQDLLRDVDRWNDRLEVHPERLQQAEERLGLLIELQRKHRVSSVEDLLALKDDFADRLHHIDHAEEEIALLQAQAEAEQKRMTALAAALTAKRSGPTKRMEKYMVTQLQPLGMPYAEFHIVLSPKAFDETGADRVTFLFSANRNKSVQPIGEIASGGEISRLMLCLKALLAEQSICSTLIFDEIDTGVSGEIAHRMALLMQEIAAHRQVLCITHLPQIAAAGAHHCKVYKTEEEEQTVSGARWLSPEERVLEIAQMVSNGVPGEAARENARQLLNHSCRQEKS